ncbi:4-oxalocrotonate decarboxylase [Streptomyces sp. NPDC048636]|uniref:2-keto-4-pentenoate hydratase n=1 Tax=Streptomyces sp. NPDC048636 TaxID=3155762 RepID=UPI00343768CF
MITEETTAALADRLDTARTTRTATPSLADTHSLHVDDAYAVQRALVARRRARGERLTGVKLGFTSEAKMAQMGVSEVIVGRLTDAMRVADDGDLALAGLIHPKVEPEIAYRLGYDVDPGDPTSFLVGAVDAVAPALEIIDSRYRDFRFTYEDVIADNTSAAAYVLGPWSPPQDLGDRKVLLTSGVQEATGSTSAILGDPVRALHALRDICHRRMIPLRAGEVILAGAATAALPLVAGTTRAEVAGLGSVTVRGV